MKPSKNDDVDDDDDGGGDVRRHARREGNIENRKVVLRIGARVERELDGLWFPATIVGVDDDGMFELEYDEDHNREMDISAEELR